jgi:hypothetical protein
MDFLLTCGLFRIPAERMGGILQSDLHVSPEGRFQAHFQEGRAQNKSVPHGGSRSRVAMDP